ncbi:MAG: VacJ family lipoprotein [Betaproteobacteria bacterium]|nr:VacJ family lipoprotein [Betaproteobacteria bacterium]MCC6249150.1 VacJ family lipoprotein [Rubrivivax sp.]MCL4697703.1 VacJ family lipoprotein [Burkholderiaceae bacterium]
MAPPSAARLAARLTSRLVAPALVALTLAGCASAPPAAGAPPMGTHPADPWEAFNRRMYAFNDVLDTAIMKPVALAYRDHVPELVRRGVDNVIGNIGDAWSAVNHLLQGKLESGLNMGTRFFVNTFIGLGGLLDPATEMKLTRRSEDFGQTLGVWGVGPGPYVVWPFFGPRTVRDTFGSVVDMPSDPSWWPATLTGRYATAALVFINTRTNLLAASDLLDQVALDRYTFLRDAYLQRRLDAVYDGAPPMETFDEEHEEGNDAEPPAAAPATPAAPATK